MSKVFITIGGFDSNFPEAYKMLQDHGVDITIAQDKNWATEEFKANMSQYDAVITGGEIWNEELFKYAKNVKILARFGVGFDNIDIDKAKEYGIKVTITRVPELSNGVAELALALMISSLRKIPQLSAVVKSGSWAFNLGSHVAGRTVGIIGFGSIGQRLAELLQPFGVKILAYDEFPNHEKAKQLNATFVSFEEVLKSSNIVSLHTPSNKNTFHLMGEKQFTLMKRNAIFINTSRGATVDEAAMFQALVSKKIAGAASDVFEKEPTDPKNPLLTLDSFIGLPHIGGNCNESFRAMSISTSQSVVDCLEGREVKLIVNP